MRADSAGHVPPDAESSRLMYPRRNLSSPGCSALTLELLRFGVVDVLGRMPWSSNATLLVEVRNGGDCLRAVYKPRRGERPLWDFPDGLDRREVAAYELSTWLGWDIVPETVLRDDDGLPFGVGSLQRFVSFDAEQHYFTLIEDQARHDALRTICCFDLVANSADRKGGHCLAGDDGRLWAVDNGLTFHGDSKLRTVIWEFGGQPIPDHLVADVRRLAEEGPPRTLEPLLNPAERRALVRRAAAVADRAVFPVDHTGRRYPWPLV
ncbi:MAG TPA: SCO1664 family protein [Acidimicrobiales bacterium]|nr:SCO1664 family protein [Acidimicrobiales bacterium]